MISFPEHVRRRLEQRVASGLAAAEPDGLLSRVAAEKHAFVVCSDVGGAALLSVDGRVWDVTWDGDVFEQTDARGEVLVLVVGAETFPELRELIPVRPAAIPNCSACMGTGKFGDFEDIRCLYCAGLGWLPDDWPKPESRGAK